MKKQRMDSLLSQEYIKDALSCLLKEKPYNHISVTELCKKAGVARITFYKYFDTIDDVYRQLVDQVVMTYAKMVRKANITDNYEKMLEFCFSYLSSYESSIKNMLFSGKSYLIYEYFRDSFQDFFPLRCPNKELETVKYTSYTGGLFVLTMDWIKNGMKETPAALAHLVSKSLPFKL